MLLIHPARRVARVFLYAGLAAAMAGCGNSSAPQGPAADGGAVSSPLKYDATVTRTELGIPHIRSNRADDIASVGYGLGYAFAEDNLCTMLDDIVTIRGERAQFFGRAGTYTIPANGSTANNVDSDFFWRSIVTPKAIARFRADALPEARAATTGFKDGFNRYLGELAAGAHPGRHAACAQGAWLRPLDDDDLYRRYIRLGVLASSSVFVTNIAQAAPPAAGAASPATPSVAAMQAALAADPGPLAFFKSEKPFGSNMYALGKNATTSGVPMVFGNPHFPWTGTERLYVSHLTMPRSNGAAFDIMGSSLYGVPAILIGFNDHLAWSHTVSTAYRFTFYELTLAPGDPTSYVYGGATMKMDAIPMTIQVKEADGSMSTATRTLYQSKFGPMLTLTTNGVNIFPWSTAKAYTLRDANYENTRLINQFFKWDAAQSIDEFEALHKSVLGVPWVNTVAAGPGSQAYYGDVTVVPNVPDALAQQCGTSAQAVLLAQLMPGLALLDGSMAACEWQDDADAAAKGVFGPSHLPTLKRDDFVSNNNDSYWLTNPAQPVTGYAKIIGSEGTERTLRTRLSILQMQRRLAGTDGRPGKTFDLPTLQDVVLNSHIYSGELARDAVVSNLCATGMALGSNGPVDVSQACSVLSKWSLADNLDDVGGPVWREFWRGVTAINANLRWTTRFSATDPVNTPNGLNTANPQVQQALADAVTRVQSAGYKLDDPLRKLQHSGVIGSIDIPIFGGIGGEGAFTIVSAPTLDKPGYPVTYGNSYIQTVTWTSNGPDAKVIPEGFITYSQSTDPANPHFTDFTEAYSAKRWQRFPFHADEIAAHAQSEQRLTAAP